MMVRFDNKTDSVFGGISPKKKRVKQSLWTKINFEVGEDQWVS
jgi:hypothetical protein